MMTRFFNGSGSRASCCASAVVSSAARISALLDTALLLAVSLCILDLVMILGMM